MNELLNAFRQGVLSCAKDITRVVLDTIEERHAQQNEQTLIDAKLIDAKQKTEEVNTSNAEKESNDYVSTKGGIVLKKVGVKSAEGYSAINFLFYLREGGNMPKRIARDEKFITQLVGHIYAKSKHGLSHIDLWQQILRHYALKSKQNAVASKTQAAGLVAYLYLDKGRTLSEAFAIVDNGYKKGRSKDELCTFIKTLKAKGSKGRPKNPTTSNGQTLLKFT